MRLTTHTEWNISGRIPTFLPHLPLPPLPYRLFYMWMPHARHETITLYIRLCYSSQSFLHSFLSFLPLSFLSPTFFFISSLVLFSFLLVPRSPHPPSDLEYGLPVQVRDQALGVKDNLPQSDVGREYYLQNMEKEVGHVMVAIVIIVLLCSIHVVSTAAVSNRET